MTKPDLRKAQKLMDELFRQGYRVPPHGTFLDHYGETFHEVKTGRKFGGTESTDEQILKWATSYKNRHGKPPSIAAGPVGEPDSGQLSWEALNDRLRKRGSGLLKFLAEHGFLPPPVEVTVEKAERWVVNYYRREGKLPNVQSVPIGELDSSNITWQVLDWRLSRHLDSSLMDIFISLGFKTRGLEVDQVLRWANRYTQKHGTPPTTVSGLIGEEDSGDTTWGSVDQRLRKFHATSLSKFCVKHGLRQAKADITLGRVKVWVKTHFGKTGVYPLASDYNPIGEPDSGALSWGTVNKWLRGEGLSLSKVCVDLGIRKMSVDDVTEEQIKTWVSNHFKEHGEFPKVRADLISQPDSGGLTWGALNQRLTVTTGQSLREFGLQHGLAGKAPITCARVTRWVESYLDSKGKPPAQGSGLIGESDSGTLVWSNIDQWLRKNHRSSLPKFTQACKLWEPPVELTEALVKKWVKLYISEHGRYPTHGSGAIGYDGETRYWCTVDSWVKKNGYANIHTFLVQHFGKEDRPGSRYSSVVKNV